MKLTAILLTLFCVQVSASGHAQKVTISRNNASLEDILLEINKQTGYSYSANADMLSHASRVSLHVKDVNLETVLDICFRDQPLSFSVKNSIIIIKGKAAAPGNAISSEQVATPPIDIKGRIVNEKGEPVAANIRVKGTTHGASTNNNGQFELKGVDENAVLLITGVGIESFEIRVSGRTELNLSAKIRVKEVEEVVVANTGYQAMKPNETNGSVVVIDKKTLNEQTGTNILQRLNGITTAVYFNIGKFGINSDLAKSKTNIRIRGESTINGPLDPLIVLDNFPYDGDINNINPNDIESITILKDAAATSIYGAQGGNGVIVITTKKGQFNQKPKIELNSTFITSKHTDLYSLSNISVNDVIDVEQYLFDKGFFNSSINNTIQRPALPPAVEVFLKRKNSAISAADSASQINILKSNDVRDQLNKYLFRNNLIQQHSIRIKGGSDNLAWIVGGSFERNITELHAANDKVNLRINNTYKPFKNLEIDLGVYYTRAKSETGSPGYYEIINNGNGRYIPYLRLIDDNDNSFGISKYRSAYLDTAGVGALLDWRYYPLEDYKYDKLRIKREDIAANIGIKYQFTKSLGINVLYRYQRQAIEGERLSDIESYYTRDLINKFTLRPNVYQIPRGSIKYLTNSALNTQNLRGQINFSHAWKNHFISMIAGSEIREIVLNDGVQQTVYGYTENPLGYRFLDFSKSYPTFISGNFEPIPGDPKVNSIRTTRYVSAYSNFSYVFKQKYSLSGSFRKDASNTFGLNANDKWTPLWSVGLGWDLSKESFYRFNRIPYLKIVATFGYSGNVDPSKGALPILSYVAQSPPNLVYPAARIASLNNPSLRWEKSRQLNLRLEFETIRKILAGRIEYYRKKGTDLYGESLYDYTTWGFLETIMRNAADMKGSGIDIDFRTQNINCVFKWQTNLLFSYTTNEVTQYYGSSAETGVQLISGSGNVITPVVGKPLYALAAYKWGGLDEKGDPQGVLNGQLTTDYNTMFTQSGLKGLEGDHVIYIGPANPTVFGNIINRFQWKGVSVSINISYKFNYYFRKPVLSYLTLFNTGLGNKEFEARWQKPGDELLTNVPAMVYTDYQIDGKPAFGNRNTFYAYSDINVLKADNIRLQYINFNYSIGLKGKKIPIESINLGFNVANLGILWRSNSQNIDPDNPLGASIPKIYSINANINF